MDSIEEPQKKVFKARKTMRVSDRQQLDAVHRVKEELLRTDGKLVNGNHENGDLGPTSPLENRDCSQDREEVNGIDGTCLESEESKPEWKETPCISSAGVKNKQEEDLNSEALSPRITSDLASNVTTEPASGTPASDNPGCGTPASDSPSCGTPASENPASDNPASGDLAAGELATRVPAAGDSSCEEPPSSDPSSSHPSSSDPSSSDPISGDSVSEEPASDDLVSGDLTSGEPVSGESVSHEPTSGEPATSEPASDETVAGAVASCELVPGESALDDCATSGDSPSDDGPSGEESLLRRSVCSRLASGELTPCELSMESATDTVKSRSVPVCEPGPDADKTEQNSNNSDDCPDKNEGEGNLDQIQSKDSLDEGYKVDSNIGEKEETLETHSAIISSDLPPENTKKVEEDPIAAPVEEEAISSSMEVDQSEKGGHKSPAELAEAVSEEPMEEGRKGAGLDHADSMETDEIIPILEKLAPTEDELSCFSKTSLLPVETSQDLEDKMEGSFGSPSKQESSESLPKEAFLVLSDEEDISCGKEESEVLAQNKMSSPG